MTNGIEEKKMRCEKCKKVIESVGKYYLHRRKHLKLTCQNCKRIFSSKANLTNHQKKKTFDCHHCNGKFCTIEHLQQHTRSIPKEEPARSKEDTLEWIKQLDEPVYPSLYETAEGYQNLVQEKKEIRDYQETSSYYQIYNKEIDSRFTYRDIKDMLLDIYTKKRNAFKVNLGFGFILYRPINQEWKYYYPSYNNLLFEKAFTVDNRMGIKRLMRQIISLDLATNYYLKKPSSSWILAGLTNIRLQIIDLKGVPIA